MHQRRGCLYANPLDPILDVVRVKFSSFFLHAPERSPSSCSSSSLIPDVTGLLEGKGEGLKGEAAPPRDSCIYTPARAKTRGPLLPFR